MYGKNVFEGNFCVVRKSSCASYYRMDKVKYAEKAGAVGVVFVNSDDSLTPLPVRGVGVLGVAGAVVIVVQSQ